MGEFAYSSAGTFISSARCGLSLVIAIDAVIEVGLLLQEVIGCWLGGFGLQGQVHALMAIVLLRVTGLDVLDVDA